MTAIGFRFLQNPPQYSDTLLDGVEGFGSSFLEEAFGGLVRVHHFPVNELKRDLKVVGHGPVFRRYADRVWKYIEEAGAATAH